MADETRRGPSGRRGATLLELVLVMIVLFILAGVAAPRFSDFFPALQVRKTADRILAWARKARSDAALTGARHRLVFDDARKRYWIEYETRPLREPGLFERLGGSWDGEPYPDGVTLEGLENLEEENGVRFLEFRPDGTSEDASIAVANDRGDRQTIRVTGATSLVVIEAAAEE